MASIEGNIRFNAVVYKDNSGFRVDVALLSSLSDQPAVQLALGAALDPRAIKEGQDVYFDCTIHANPPARRVQWLHDWLERMATNLGYLVRIRARAVGSQATSCSSFLLRMVDKWVPGETWGR
ncbi:hypothetical protein GWK47_053273 [Chionoecetes opilio]|uniref:Ig-like domain-containing protein n=1 Tax=Chionoecetes opilio TaxID=41210 RepID=A0A8J5CSC7_CHIOP|nr:hypothetical protein GWK47_053273 [Chionoecetes opilio]